jgi:uncharacterized protein YkwD
MGICESANNKKSTDKKPNTEVKKEIIHEKDSTMTSFIKDAIDQHNKLRALHGAPSLKHDPELTKHAQHWADYLAKTNKFQHSECRIGKKMIGENIAMMGGQELSGKDATDMWYEEIQDYNFNRPGFGGDTGHFTQVVWKNTLEIGVGVAKVGSSTYVVANYYPPGNFNNDYAKNVLPKKH